MGSCGLVRPPGARLLVPMSSAAVLLMVRPKRGVSVDMLVLDVSPILVPGLASLRVNDSAALARIPRVRCSTYDDRSGENLG